MQEPSPSIRQNAEDKANPNPRPAPVTSLTVPDTAEIPSDPIEPPSENTEPVDDTAALTPQTNVQATRGTFSDTNDAREAGRFSNSLAAPRGTFSDTNDAREAGRFSNSLAAPKSEAVYRENTQLSNHAIKEVKIGDIKDEPPKRLVTPNKLFKFASYTYNLSLHALSPDDYSKLMDGPKNYTPRNVLIASGGRYDVSNGRNKIFKEDFFFDKMDVETVIGLNAQSRNANAIAINFTLIEPYGMTLLNRLIALSESDTMKLEGNYLAIPYLLQIDFLGYGDDGKILHMPEITKYIPIRIINLGMKVSQKGAEYNIQAVPFNHQAFSETVGTNPIKLEVAAADIKDYFLATVDGVVHKGELSSVGVRVRNAMESKEELVGLNSQYREVNETLIALDPGARVEAENLHKYKIHLESRIKTLTKEVGSSIIVSSYTEAINVWKQMQEEDGEVKFADRISFEIHKDIAEATFPDKESIESASTQFTNKKKDKPPETQKGEQTNNMSYGPKAPSQMTVEAGMSILDVISMAIRNSSYVYSQILDKNKKQITKTALADFLTKPVKWFKVIPRIKLGAYDKLRNEFQKEITYLVIPTIVTNTRSPDAPQGGPREYVKEYNYIFTGKNSDIINFDLKFDTLFFTAKTANNANLEITRGAVKQTPSHSKEADAQQEMIDLSEISNIINDRAKGIVEMRHRVILTGPLPGTEAGKGSTAEAIKQLNRNLLTNAQGDMISVDLKIVGDPDFIKQDDYFYSPEHKLSDEIPYKTPNESIITDANEVFVNLMFKTPSDYNDSGLAVPGTGLYSDNAFSGLYRVIRVKSNFGNGKFEQNLDLVRYPNQPAPGTRKETSSTENKRDESAEAATSDIRTNGLPAPTDAPMTDVNGVPMTETPDIPAKPHISDMPGASAFGEVDAVGTRGITLVDKINPETGETYTGMLETQTKINPETGETYTRLVNVDNGGSIMSGSDSKTTTAMNLNAAYEGGYANVDQVATPIGNNSNEAGVQIVQAALPNRAAIEEFHKKLKEGVEKSEWITYGPGGNIISRIN